MAILNSTSVKFSLFAFDKQISKDVGNNGIVEIPVFAHETYKIRVGFFNSEDGIISTDNVSYKKTFRKDVIWDFGDGTTIEDGIATHYYTVPGKYEIKCSFIDIDRNIYENLYSITVYVKEVISTSLSYVEPVSADIFEIKCSEPTNIANINITLSTLIENEPSLIPKRVWNDKESQTLSFLELYNDGCKDIHLKKYWSFLELSNIVNDTNDTVYNTLVEIEKYKPSYDTIYGQFYIDNDEIKLNCYKIIPWTVFDVPNPLLIENPNVPLSNNSYINVNINVVSSSTELPNDVFAIGKQAIINVYYKNDFVDENQTLYFAIDSDIKLKNTASNYDYYINNPPLGINIKTVESSKCNYALTLNGIIRNIDSVGSLQCIDETLYYYININTDMYIYVIPYIKHDIVGYYIPKDKIINHFTVAPDDEFKDILTTNSFYAIYNVKLTNRKTDVSILGDNTELIRQTIYAKNLVNTVVPRENYYEENFERVLNAFMSHPMFDDAYNLRAYLTNIFANNNALNYILTRTTKFFDDHSNIKTCYLTQFISNMKMFGIDLANYSYTNFEDVNELRDITRICSMNHTDLVGYLTTKAPDISVTDISLGENIGDKIFSTDVIKINNLGNISAIIRNGIEYPTKNINGNKLVIVDTYNKLSKIVNFYTVIKTTSTVSILSDYSSSWNWNLLLPENTLDNPNELIDSYYSFYILNENVDLIREGNFLDENTISAEVLDTDSWESKHGIVFDTLNKIIISSLDYNLNLDDSTKKDDDTNTIPDIPEPEPIVEETNCLSDGSFDINVKEGGVIIGGPCLINGDSLFVDRDDVALCTGDFSEMLTSISMFAGCNNMFTFDAHANKCKTAMFMFADCSSLIEFNGSIHIVEDATGMFTRCRMLETFGADLGSVFSSEMMFAGCSSLYNFTSDISHIRLTNDMFHSCVQLKNFTGDINSSFSTERMFYGCKGMTEFSSNVDSSNRINDMFNGCTKLKYVTLNAKNVLSVNNCFNDCTSLESFEGNLEKLVDSENLFLGCINLKNFNCVLSSLSSAVSMFDECVSLSVESIRNIIDSLPTYSTGVHQIGFKNVPTLTLEDIVELAEKGWAVTGSIYEIGDCRVISEGGKLVVKLDKSAPNGIVTGGPCIIDGTDYFIDNSNVKTVTGDFTNLEIALRMFSGCHNLSFVESSQPKLYNAESMFSGCTDIESLHSTEFNSELVNVKGMFSGCTSMVSSPSFSNLSKVTECNNMFNGCIELKDVYRFDNTELLTDTSFMFSNCHSMEVSPDFTILESLVNSISMYEHCESLTTVHTLPALYSLVNANYMFNECSNLKNISFTGIMYSLEFADGMFDNCISLTSESVDNILEALPDLFKKYSHEGKLITDESKYVVQDIGIDEYKKIGFKNVSVIERKHQEYALGKGWIITGVPELIGGDCEGYNPGDKFSTDAPNGIVTGGPCLVNGDNLFENRLDVLSVTNIFDNMVSSVDMFNGCLSLKTATINMPSIENASGMFKNTKLEDASTIIFSVGVNNLNETFANSSITTSAKLDNCLSLTDINGLYSGCNTLFNVNTLPETSLVESYDNMYRGCVKMRNAPDFISTLNAKSFNYTYENCISLETAPNIPNSSLLESVISMYKGCTALQHVSNLPDSKSIVSYNDMFNGCSALITAPSFNSFKSGETFNYMFKDCASLKYTNGDSSIVLPSFINIDDTNKKVSFKGMFMGCSSVENIIFNNGSFDTCESAEHMFDGCTSLSLKTIDRIIDILPNRVFSESNIIGFANVRYLQERHILSAKAKGWFISDTPSENLGDCDTFEGAFNTDAPNGIVTGGPCLVTGDNLFINRKDVSSINGSFSNLKTAVNMFNNCSNMMSINIDVPNAKDVTRMFANNVSLLDASDIVFEDDLQNINELFNNCTSLIHLPDFTNSNNISTARTAFSNTDITQTAVISSYANMIDLSYAYENCNKLLIASDINASSKLQYINSMFKNCEMLIYPPSIEDTSLLSNLNNVFENCYSLINGLEVNSLHSCTEMIDTYKNCTNLIHADNINDIYNVTTTAGMFENCQKLESVSFSDKTFTSLIDATAMFNNCYDLSESTITAVIDKLPFKTTEHNIGFLNVKSLTDKHISNALLKGWIIEGTPGEVLGDCESINGIFNTDAPNGIVTGGPCLVNGDNLFKNRTNVSKLTGTFTNMVTGREMFDGCRLIDINVSMESIRDCYKMFSNNINLVTIENVSLSKDTTSVAYMFSNCNKLKSNIIFSDDNAITNMSYMYENCKSLSNISTLGNTAFITSMNGTFKGCALLENITFNENSLSSLKQGEHIFDGCTILSTETIDKFIRLLPTNDTDSYLGFSGVLNLKDYHIHEAACKGWVIDETPEASNGDCVDGVFSTAAPNGIVTGGPCLTNASINIVDGSVLYEGLFQNRTDVTEVRGVFAELLNGGEHYNRAMFGNCINLETAFIKAPKMNKARYMFADCVGLKRHCIEAPSLINCGGMFYNCPSITSITLDIPNATDIDSLFSGCYNLESYTLNAPLVTDFSGVFKDCKKINSIDLDLSRALSTENMYNGSGVDTVDIDLPVVLNVSGMFANTTISDFSNFNINNNVEYISSLFEGCTNLINAPDLSSFTSVKSCDNLFNGCTNLKTYSIFDDFENVTSTYRMFAGCSSLTEITNEFNNFTNKHVVYGMFSGCHSLISIPDIYFNISVLPDQFISYYTLDYMFNECKSLIDSPLTVVGDNLYSIKYMYNGCEKIKSIKNLPVSTKLTHAKSAFKDCHSLETAPVFGATRSLNDISSICENCYSLVSGIKFTSISNLFYADKAYKNCTSLITMPNMSTVSKLLTVREMFSGCTAIETTPIFTTATNIISTQSMFSGCESLISGISLSSCSKLQYADNMYLNCTSLTSVPNWNSNVKLASCESIYENCTSLVTVPAMPDIEESTYNLPYEYNYQSAKYSYNDYTALVVPSLNKCYKNCSSLVTIPKFNKTSLIYTIDEICKNCEKLETISFTDDGFESLISAVDAFNNCTSLSTSTILHIVNLLPNRTDSGTYHEIGFYNVPNITAEHIDIAENKGWFVNTTKENSTIDIGNCLTPSGPFDASGIIDTISGGPCVVDGNGIIELIPEFLENDVAEGLSSVGYNTFFTDKLKYINGNFENLIDIRYILPAYDGATSNVTLSVFNGCFELIDVDAEFPKLENGYSMFNGCSNIVDLAKLVIGDNLINSNYMFNNAAKLRIIPTFGRLNNLETTQGMFNGCVAIESVILPNLPKLTTATSMFSGCKELKSVILGTTVLDNLENAENMFNDCEQLSVESINHIIDILPIRNNSINKIGFKNVLNINSEHFAAASVKGWTIETV